MSSRPQTPASSSYAPVNELNDTARPVHLQSGSRPVSYVGSAAPGGHGTATEHSTVHSTVGAPRPTSALSQNHEFESNHVDGTDIRPGTLQRSASQMSQGATSRSGTLKKKASLKGGSLNRSRSRKSSYAGSVRSMKLGEKEKYDTSNEETTSAFYCPVPTSGNPTELLATRFQGMSDFSRRYSILTRISLEKSPQRSHKLLPRSTQGL